MSRVLGLIAMLSLFWLLLSGHYTPLLLALGAASVALVAWLARRMQIVDEENRALEMSLRAPRYWLWLAGQIGVSAAGLARRIWTPGLPVSPALRRIEALQMSDLERATYANSISLTPGTLALDVSAESIEVHSIDPALLDALADGRMAARVRRMGLA